MYTVEQRRFSRLKKKVTGNPECSTLSVSKVLNPWSHQRNRRPSPPGRLSAEPDFSTFKTKESTLLFMENQVNTSVGILQKLVCGIPSKRQ